MENSSLDFTCPVYHPCQSLQVFAVKSAKQTRATYLQQAIRALFPFLPPMFGKLFVASCSQSLSVANWTTPIAQNHLGTFGAGSPNSVSLCIVPKQGEVTAEDVLLPFESVRMPSVILSKAFLLADDPKIKDPTIISQIERSLDKGTLKYYPFG
jgi:hypothetical protein